MQIISTTALISINETLLFQVVSFLIFLFIINRVMFRPLQHSMGQRVKHVDQINRDIVDAEDEIERLTMQIEEERLSVQKDAQMFLKELEKSGAEQAEVIFTSAKEEIDTLKDTTKTEIDLQISEARKHIKEESETLAVHIMEKIVDRRLVS